MPLVLPTGRQGRLLALGFVVLALLALWAGVAAPLADLYQSQGKTLQQRAALARRMAALAESLPALKQQASNGSARALAPATLEGASDALASARLQDLVQGFAAGAGATLSSVETLPAEAAGTYRRVAVKVSLGGNLQTLTHVISQIEDARPSMLIDDLQIHGSPLNLPGTVNQLETSFTVYGFRSAEGK